MVVKTSDLNFWREIGVLVLSLSLSRVLIERRGIRNICGENIIGSSEGLGPWDINPDLFLLSATDSWGHISNNLIFAARKK